MKKKMMREELMVKQCKAVKAEIERERKKMK